MSLLNYQLNLDQFADSLGVAMFRVYAADKVTLIDLTSAHARLMIKHRASDADSAAVVSITDVANSQGQIILGGSAGTVLLNITKVATALMGGAQTQYVYDLFVDFPTATSLNIVSGSVVVSAAVTQP